MDSTFHKQRHPLSTMMKVVFIIFLSLLCHLPLHAQIDTRGTDFWVTFGRNTYHSYNAVDLQIRVVGSDQAATVTIYFTNLNTSTTFSIAGEQVYTYNLNDAQKQAVYNEWLSSGISNLSANITSSYPVTVYALNQHVASTDATNILPVTALGTDYYHISYMTTANDAYAIVATEDATQVSHNGSPSVTLNTGDTYYRASGSDMTGAHVTANKPIAFFAVNQGVQIPNGSSFIDCLFQQLAPVNTWGKNFFVPVSYRGRDRVRIMVSQNNTTISQIGGTIQSAVGGQTTLAYPLNAGQWVELEVSLTNNGCYIQADKPIGVCPYLTGAKYYPSSPENSDPAQAWLPAIEQKISSALTAPFIPEGYTHLDEHYALVVTSTATKNNTTVKIGAGAEQALSGGTWYDNAVAGMSFYSMPLTSSTVSYLYTNTFGRLIIMGYGTGFGESYYYLASSALRSLDAAFYVNDIHYQDLAVEFTCAQPVEFHAEISGDISTTTGYLKWYIDGMEETAAQDQLDWSKTLTPGTYQIEMVVLMDNGTPKTVAATLTVTPLTPIIVNNSTICSGETVTLTVTNPAAGATYTWYDATGLTSLGNGISYTTPALTNTTNYVVKVTGVDCPDAPTTVTVMVTPLTSIIVNNPTICYGETVTLTVTNPVAGATYTWYDATGLTSLGNGLSYTTPALTSTINYVVKVEGAPCQPAPATVTVTVTPLTLIIVNNPAICSGETVTLTVTNPVAGATYTWYDATGLTSLGNGVSYTTPALTGTINYVVKVTGVDCPDAPTTVTVTVNPLPVVTITAYPEIVCSGGPTVLTASVGAGATSSMSYTWYEGTTPLETTTINTYIVSALTATATYSVYVVNSYGCSNTSNTTTVTIMVNPLPVTNLTASPEIVCSGESSTLTATVTTGLTTAMSYTWYEGSNLLGTTAENTYTTNALTATSTYSVWVVNSHGCFWISNTLTVAVNPLPEVSITASSTHVCSGNAVTLTATVSGGTTTAMTYTWYSDATPIATTTDNTYNLNVLASNYSVEVVNSHNCSAQGSITISVTLPPSVTAMDDQRICYGEEITLTTLAEDGDIISWNTPQTTVRLTASTYFIVTATRPPCPDAKDTVRITVGDSLYIFPSILPSFQRNRFYEQQLQTNAASPLFTIVEGELPEGLLLHSNGIISGIPILVQQEESNYIFTVEVLDKFDCSVTKIYTMNGEFSVPVVFSPNDDEVNDYFMQGYKVIIFDRLGVKIFEGNDGWDGTYNGSTAPQDTYFYIFFYIDANGREAQKTGSITLFR